MRVEAKGFKTAEHRDVVVQVGQDTRVDVTLEIGASTPTVTVTEAIPFVDTTGPTLGGTIENTVVPVAGKGILVLAPSR